MTRHRGGSALGAVAHGSGACCASPLRHLKPGAVARNGDAYCASPYDTPASAKGFLSSNHRVPLRWQGIGSRFHLNMEPGADGRDSGKMTVAFSLTWLKPLSVLLQTGLDLCHRCGGPVSVPGGSRRTTTLLHAPCSSKQAPVLPLRQGVIPASARYERPPG